MLSEFSVTVLQGTPLSSYAKQDKRLLKIFHEDLNGSFESWKQVCKNITRSKFLMGESKSSSFKATLDWALKEKNTVRILEGDFGIGDRSINALEKDTMTSKIGYAEQIKNSNDDALTKQIKLWCLQALGTGIYQAWFKDINVEKTSDIHYRIYTSSRFCRDRISTHYHCLIETYLRKADKNNAVQLMIEARELSPLYSHQPNEEEDIYYVQD